MTKPDMRIKMGPACFPGIKDLDENKSIDESQIRDICAYIDERYDCADFRMVCIIHHIYIHLLSEETIQIMKRLYWISSTGWMSR